MSSSSQPDNERILRLVGAIVLVSQDAERYLKITLPFIAAEDSSLGASLKRHEKLKKRTLGELAGKFVDSTTSDSLDFAKHMAYLVATRNQVVHHFNETYGVQLNAGSYQEVFDSLERAGPIRLNSQAVFDKWIACGFKLPSARAAAG